MRAHRPFRHVLAVILQIAALLALTIAAPAHARGHGAAEHAHAQIHHASIHADHAGIDAVHGTEAAEAARPAGDSHSGSCCGLHCPFHIPFVGVTDVTVALRWNAEAAFRRPRDASFASVVSEALPEPPRSFA